MSVFVEVQFETNVHVKLKRLYARQPAPKTHGVVWTPLKTIEGFSL